MNRGRVGKERGGKETDGCPFTLSTVSLLLTILCLNRGNESSCKGYEEELPLCKVGFPGISVRGHPSVSLLPVSSPTLHLFICILPPHLCTILKDHTHS
jgi:hypothetical protein